MGLLHLTGNFAECGCSCLSHIIDLAPDVVPGTQWLLSKYWVGHRVCSGFSYGKTWMNLLAKPLSCGMNEWKIRRTCPTGRQYSPPCWPDTISRSESHPWNVFRSSLSSVQFSRTVVSDSLRPHELQHTRPPCPHLKTISQKHICLTRYLGTVQPSCPLTVTISLSYTHTGTRTLDHDSSQSEEGST